MNPVVVAAMIAWASQAPDAGAVVAPPAPSTADTAKGDPATDLTKLATELRQSVVHIAVEAPDGPGIGTGFVVDKNGLIATNFHVIEGASAIKVKMDGGRALEVQSFIGDEAHDLAVLKVAATDLIPLELGEGDHVPQGTKIVLLGNPRGLSMTLSDGIVSAIRDDGLGKVGPHESWRQRLIQTTAPISPGSSGSPAVTLDRRVIGVTMGERLGGQNLNFLIPAERLDELMRDATTTPEKLSPVSQVPWLNLGISAGFFLCLGVGFWWLRRPKTAKPKTSPPPKKPKEWVH